MIPIPSDKHSTKSLPIERMEAPELLYLPLDAYRNTMQPIVRPGQQVKKYQQVARSEGVFAARSHAPVSGIVKEIEEIDGKSFLVLQNDFKEEALPVQLQNLSELTNQDLLEILVEYGIEGSGGARFPTHLKYNVGTKEIETFIINAVECEPYLNTDFVLMRDHIEALFKAIEVIQKLIHARQIVFGIERHNKELKSLIEQKNNIGNGKVRVKLLPDEYPQGGELQLIQSVTGKEIPKGNIPADAGVVVSNVGTLWAVYQAFFEGKPYTERVITVSGNKSSKKGNYWVKIGTPVEHILLQTGHKGDLQSQTVILGGPMMGKAVQTLKTPVHKGTGGVLILNNPKTEAFNCIECGYCVDVCPQHLMPMEFVRFYQEKDDRKLKAFHLQDCIECGACAYICPSEVPLMESIFKGKEIIA